MPAKLKIFAASAVLAVGMSSAAMAQYACAPGYAWANGVCQPVSPQGYGNPVSGAVSGEASGAARGAAAAGPVGAVVGGAARHRDGRAAGHR